MPQNDSSWINGPSVFTGHSLQPIHSDPIFREGTTLYWPSVLLFIVFALYVSIKVSAPKKIFKVFASVFSLQAAKQLLREDYKLNKRVSVFLSIGFLIVMAFLVYITNNYFGLILEGVSPLKKYLFFLTIITSMYVIKFLMTYLLSFVISEEELGKEYSFNVFVFSQTIGVVLFPVVLCIQFSKYPAEWFLYPGLIICAGFFALRLFRGIVISVLEQNVGILYIFLYLCALEILPILVLIKFLLNNF